MATQPIPPGLKISKEEWGKLSEASQKLFSSLFKQVRSLSERGAEERDLPLDVGDLTAGIGDQMTQLEKQTAAAVNTLRNLQSEFGSFVYNPDIQRGLKNTIKSMDEFIGSGKLGANAYENLSRQLSSFQRLSAAAFKTTDSITKQQTTLSGELSNQAALLKKLGLGFGDFAKNVDSAIYSFGLNENAVKSFNLQIKDLADSLKMMPSEVSRNFQIVSKNMAYDLNTIKDQFVKFQKLSLQTGIGVDTLSSNFGQRMDTIQGASSAAASINQMLGYNAFSATELLMMSDADRATAIREAVVNDPSIMGDIKTGGPAGKFALSSVAEMLNMDRDTARRFITTGDPGSVKAKMAADASADASAATAESFKTVKDSTDKFSDAMVELRDQVLRTVSDFKAIQIRARGRTMADLRTGIGAPTTFQQAGVIGDLGIMPKGVRAEGVVRALAAGAPQEGIMRLLKAAQMQVIDPTRVNQIIARLSGDSASDDFKSAEEDLQEILRAVPDSTELIEKFISQNPGAASGLAAVFNMSEFAGRLLLGRIARNEIKAADLEAVGGKASETLKKELQFAKSVSEAQDTFNKARLRKTTLGTEQNPGTVGLNESDFTTLETSIQNAYRTRFGDDTIVPEIGSTADQRARNRAAREEVKPIIFGDGDLPASFKRGVNVSVTSSPVYVKVENRVDADGRITSTVKQENIQEKLDKSFKRITGQE